MVLGGDSQVLDLGVGRRFFTAAQRAALAVRDGGCVWPGCPAPPGWCEAHHVVAWEHGGPTDLSNAALLCPFHHHRLDVDGWGLTVEAGIPWLRPPAWVEAGRRPRRGGRRSPPLQ